MVDIIVYEEQESKYLIVIKLRIIIHRTLYKKGQCIIISNLENNLDNSSFNIKNYNKLIYHNIYNKWFIKMIIIYSDISQDEFLMWMLMM